jgi:hypothetical protein
VDEVCEQRDGAAEQVDELLGRGRESEHKQGDADGAQPFARALDRLVDQANANAVGQRRTVGVRVYSVHTPPPRGARSVSALATRLLELAQLEQRVERSHGTSFDALLRGANDRLRAVDWATFGPPTRKTPVHHLPEPARTRRRKHRYAGKKKVARPGLEPGTPRFSVVTSKRPAGAKSLENARFQQNRCSARMFGICGLSRRFWG